jgi:hypothetical protein
MPEPLNLDLGLGNQNPVVETPPPDNSQDFSTPFLESVSPEHRAIVEPYVKQWDSQVTPKFQEFQSQLKPYQELGDIDSLSTAMRIMKFAETDPGGFLQYVYDTVQEMGAMPEEFANQFNQGQTPPVGETPPVNLPEFEGMTEAQIKMFRDQQSKLEKFEKFMTETETEKQTKTQQQQLDKLLSDLSQSHGKFDEDAVLGRMLRGMSPEDAVNDWKKFQKELNTPARETPPPAFGGGRTVLEQVDSSKLKNPTDRKALVAQMLG